MPRFLRVETTINIYLVEGMGPEHLPGLLVYEETEQDDDIVDIGDKVEAWGHDDTGRVVEFKEHFAVVDFENGKTAEVSYDELIFDV